MGSPRTELGRRNNETLHMVKLTKHFWLGETEVTQGQWKAVMGENPSISNEGDNYPVDSVTWLGAMAFCANLNERYGNMLPKGYKFSLPTEAQWEYACRAGIVRALNNGWNITCEDGFCPKLNEVGLYNKNSSSSHEVKEGMRNAWGFFDMHGNVREWCSDMYDKEYGCDSKPVTDPQGANNSAERVNRGGGWSDSARCCRAAHRGTAAPTHSNNHLGFRLALVPVQ